MADQPQSSTEAPKSRYQRVKEILDAAAGTATADYQGRGRFWNLPLPEFLEVVIYGVRMIAPLDESHCSVVTQSPSATASTSSTSAGGCGCGGCGSESADAAASATAASGSSGFQQPRQAGRGAQSGLIRGLKGQFPFDGSHFPRLLWGGNAVSAADILFIEQWIDDGCPQDEPHNLHLTTLRNRAIGIEPHPVSLKPTNAYRYETGQIKQRKDVECLSEDEIAKLRCAIQELKSYPDIDRRSYRAWGRIHGDMCMHGWEQFLPWHRVYLYYFEQALQDISPEITLPYWDWTHAAYNQGQIPQGAQSGIIPTIYRCFMTETGLSALAQAGVPSTYLAALPKVKQLFNSGVDFFAQADQQFHTDKDWLGYRKLIENQLGQINPLWHPFRYPGMFGDKSLGNPYHHHYPTADDIDELLQIPNFRDFGGGPQYDESFGDLDMNPHNTMHIWSGGNNPLYNRQIPDFGPSNGDMLSNLTAAYDPIFWGHHSNVDRLWALWQEQHPGQNPAGLTGILAPYSETVADTLLISQFGYEYAKASYLFETDQNHQISQFRSETAGVHPKALANHRKAELRLHHIIQPNQSMIARVFLNQPDANAHTPIQDNKHYAGYVALFGHGPCIGASGHCDPPGERRPHDRRPRHHNTPWNARLDVTDTVKQLVADGATDLDINIVVIGVDGRATTDMLRMDAVSLTFKD